MVLVTEEIPFGPRLARAKLDVLLEPNKSFRLCLLMGIEDGASTLPLGMLLLAFGRRMPVFCLELVPR